MTEKRIVTPENPFGDLTPHVRAVDAKIEKVLDVTFVEFAKLPSGDIEMVHPASGKRKVITFPKGMTNLEERAQFMQEIASRFVRDEVKPHG